MGIYQAIEDKYYALLDRIDQYIPIYKVIDPIDEVVPSLLLFAALFFLLLLLVFFAPLIFPQPAEVYFRVEDEQGSALAGIEVSITSSAGTETFATGGLGEFTALNLRDESVLAEANADGYKPYSRTITVDREKTNIIVLEAEGAGQRALSIRIQNSSRELLKASVSLEFSCSGSGAPAGLKTSTGQAGIQVPLSCGTLTITAFSPGYATARETVEVASEEHVTITMSAESAASGRLSVAVTDSESGKPLAGIELRLYRVKGGTADLPVSASETDSSGMKLFEELLPAEYYARAEDPSGKYEAAESEKTAVRADEISSVTIELALRQAEAKKLYLKFVEEGKETAVSGVKVSLFEDNISFKEGRSNNDGELEFRNLESGHAFSITASHPDYVTRAVDSLRPVESSGTKPKVIELTPISEKNSGKVEVEARDYSGIAVDSATVFLYSKKHAFWLGQETTGENGIAAFPNMPPGTYYAYAEKGESSGSSGEGELKAGKTLALSVILVLGNGELEVSVEDEAGKPISGAKAEFFDSVTGNLLASEETLESGTTLPVSFRIDARPYVVVSKRGYVPYTTRAYGIKINAPSVINVVLRGEETFSAELGIKLAEILDAKMKTAERLAAASAYYFRLELSVPEGGLSNVAVLVRAGLQENENAEGSVIVIKGVEKSIASAVFSSCYLPEDNYADCEITAGDAKQVRLEYGKLSKGVYEFLVMVYIKEVPEEEKKSTVIEARYGAKGNSSGATIYKPSESELYLASFKFGPLCRKDCPLLFELEIEDPTGEFLPERKALGDEITELPLEREFILHYKIFNQSGKDFYDALLSLSNDNAALEIEPGSGEFSIGTFEQGTWAANSARFSTALESGLTTLTLSLNVNHAGSTAAAKFSVLPNLEMKMDASPKQLTAGQATTITVSVSDAASGEPLQNARISVYSLSQGRESPMPELTTYNDGRTDETGIYFITFPAYDSRAGSQREFIVRAEKPRYRTAEEKIGVGEWPAAFEGNLDCVSITPLAASCLRGGSVSFTIKNNGCESPVEFSLGTVAASDIRVTPSPASDSKFTLAPGASQAVNVKTQQYLGIHPVFIYANFPGEIDIFHLATFEATVTDPTESCIEIAGNKFAYDLLHRDDGAEAMNKCYTGYFDDYPDTRAHDSAGYYLNVQAPKREELLFRITSGGMCGDKCHLAGFRMFNRGINGEQYILIYVEDYITGQAR